MRHFHCEFLINTEKRHFCALYKEHTMYKYLITCLVGLVLCLQTSGQNFKASTPDWVKEVSIPEPSEALEGGGIQYLLTSHQVNFKKRVSYRKEVFLLKSADAVANYSNLSVLYDPSYQSLKFHSINVFRNGEKIDKLSTHSINTYQREGNMERSIYDGSYTAVINLSDIRQNDILEYSYTLSGSHPAFPDHLYSTHSFQSSVPVGRIHYSVLMPDLNPIPYSVKNSIQEPEKSKVGNQLCYEWDVINAEQYQYFEKTPPWFRTDFYVEFSNYKNWAKVVSEIEPFYRIDLQDEFYFKEVINRFDAEFPDDRIIAAIRFVQNEIRYLGFETGLNAYRPHLAKEVYNQRYGDCKDKSFLLVNLLRTMGYEAYPMLVNSYLRQGLVEYMPSPYNFDHVVVKLIYQNNEIYIDPTISNQGGDIFNLNFPSYSKGLVIKAGEGTLETIPNKNRNDIYVIEDLVIAKDNSRSAEFRISSDYSGFAADNLRNYLANSSLEDVKKEYLNYYKGVFPNIKSAKDITVEDDFEKNVIHIYEAYEVDSLWQETDGVHSLSYFPAQIRDIFKINLEANRKAPIELTFPHKVENRTRIWVPEPWPVNVSSYEKEHEAFSYTNKVDYHEQANKPYILLTHTYQTKKNEVSLSEINRFEQVFNDVYDSEISFELYYSSGKTGFSWQKTLLILFSLGVLVLAIFLAIKVYRNYDPKPENWALKHERQIGSWLFLPLIGLIISCLRFLYIILTSGYFNVESWSVYLDNTSTFFAPSMAGLILFELIAYIFLLVFSVQSFVLFINQRSSLPKIISILYGASCLFTLLDVGIYHLVYPNEPFEDGATLFRSLLAAFIWIPVFLRSERVKETFTKTRASQIELQLDAQEEKTEEE